MSHTLRDVVLRSRRFGDLVAVRAGDADRTYAELVDRSIRLARHLRDRGLASGDRVAVMVEDGIRALEPHLAAAVAGLVIVPVNARFRSAEVEHIVRDSGAKGLVHSSGVASIVDSIEAPSLVVTIDTGGAAEHDSLTAYEDVVRRGSAEPPQIAVSADDLVMIGYTSGTTGRPKGAMMSNGGAIAAVRSNIVAFRVIPYGACAFSGSVSFTALFWAFIVPHLFVGASIDFLQPGLTMERWFERMERFGSTFTFVPTPYMDQFATLASQNPAAIARLAGVCHSASPASSSQRSAMVEALGGAYVESYGMTESLAAVSATTRLDADATSAAADRHATIGRPIAPADVYPVDADGLRLGPDEVGELVIESPSLFVGYWNNDAASADALRDGRYFTGDLGHVDGAGFVYIDGRKADLIISGGMNVYPAEVEGELQTHPAVREVAVIGIPHERWGEAVAAVIVVEPGASLDEDAVIRFVGDRLASYKKPTRAVFVDALPRNANLKLIKSELGVLFS